MRIKETKVFQLDELSDHAKERAREWWRAGAFDSTDWADFVIEDSATIAAMLGIELRTRPVKLMGGGTRYEPCIYWSGFSSQGDGACFEGRYSFKPGSVKAIRAHAPQDTELHRIASGLASVQRRYFYQAELSITQRGRYTHSNSAECEDIGERELSAADFETMQQLLRDFMDWIYAQLEKEWDYQNADEQVDENIRANEYEFTEEGKRA